jgi:penicillin-binding protein 1A
MISIRILQTVGAQNAQEWATHFGFEAAKHPAYLTMALGAGSVTPMQMASAYSVFANGGYRVNPWLIAKVTDQKGKVLVQNEPPALDEPMRVIDARNAFIMSSLLQEVTRSGTAASAQAKLKRPDLYGKTGTTNDSVDAWFAGYQPTLTAITWIGYDTPKNLGSRETGGGLSLPIWIDFMEKALRGVTVAEYAVPEGVVNSGGEWFYTEYSNGAGVASLGSDNDADPNQPQVIPMPAADEKKKIMDLFKN